MVKKHPNVIEAYERDWRKKADAHERRNTSTTRTAMDKAWHRYTEACSSNKICIKPGCWENVSKTRHCMEHLN